MCGIAGYHGPWENGLGEAMRSCLRHRGPDGDDIVHFQDDRVTLVHTRLSIIDISDAGRQPMTSACGRYVITYNGELYNYPELAADLKAEGVRFRSHSDTEVLLEFFARYGLEGLNRLNGMFAFAVWDTQEKRLTLVRDHAGIKPLYFSPMPEGFAFASELKALVLCPDVSRDIDVDALFSHVGYVWTCGRQTILKGVQKLRPGEYLTYTPGEEPRIGRYFDVVRSVEETTPANMGPEEFRDLLDQVVARQMVSDVPLGALLSGGLDSSAIVASMRQHRPDGPIVAFCASETKTESVLDNVGDDELYADQVARNLNIELVKVPTEARLADSLQGMLWDLDEPNADFASLQVQQLATAAQHAGIKVLLTGVGGDDLLAGYPRHRVAYLRAWLDRFPGLTPLLGGLLRQVHPNSLRGRRLAKTGLLLSSAPADMAVEAMHSDGLLNTDIFPLLSDDVRKAVPAEFPAGLKALRDQTARLHPVDRQIQFEIAAFLPDHNLNYTDKMAMKLGVETRVPLLDREIVEKCQQLPLSSKIGWRTTKRILRESQRGRLPEGVLERPKQGFGVPLRRWITEDGAALLKDTLSPARQSSRGLFDAAAVARLHQDVAGQKVDAAQILLNILAIELWLDALADYPPWPAPYGASRDAKIG